MSARVSLASASGFSSLPRPPSRARRGSSVPPPVSVIDQVLQKPFYNGIALCCQDIFLHSKFAPTQVFLDQLAETVGIFDLRKRTLPGRVWPSSSTLHCFEWCWDWWSTQRANHRNKDHQDGQITRFGPRRLMAGVRSWEGGHILEFICGHYIQTIRICLTILQFILFCLNQYMATLKVKGKSGGDPKKGQRGGGGEAALGERGLEGEG